MIIIPLVDCNNVTTPIGRSGVGTDDILQMQQSYVFWEILISSSTETFDSFKS